MNTPPLVSVVIPSFNQAEFLEEALRSVALQDYRPIEQIVIDGGSRDGTVDLLRRWTAEDHRAGYACRWISEPDRGHADGLNKGFGLVTGDIVGWLNSDDVYFDRRAVTCAVEALAAHPEVDVVFGDVALISETSGLWSIWSFPKFDYKRALRNYIIPQPTVFFRRCVTDKYRLDPALKVAVDHVYWLQIGREHKFLHVGRVQAGDRDHSKRQTHINRTLWQQTATDMCRRFGGDYRPGTLEKYHDVLVRLLMRFKGVLHLAAMFARPGLPADLAFPMWIDNKKDVLIRQLTMRLGNRPRLRRPAAMSRKAEPHRTKSST